MKDCSIAVIDNLVAHHIDELQSDIDNYSDALNARMVMLGIDKCDNCDDVEFTFFKQVLESLLKELSECVAARNDFRRCVGFYGYDE